MARKCRSRFLPCSGHDVQNTGRKDVFDELHQAQHRERRIFGRLQNQTVAGGKSHANLDRSELEWRVPWDDRADDAVRFPCGIAE